MKRLALALALISSLANAQFSTPQAPSILPLMMARADLQAPQFLPPQTVYNPYMMSGPSYPSSAYGLGYGSGYGFGSGYGSGYSFGLGPYSNSLMPYGLGNGFGYGYARPPYGYGPGYGYTMPPYGYGPRYGFGPGFMSPPYGPGYGYTPPNRNSGFMGTLLSVGLPALGLALSASVSNGTPTFTPSPFPVNETCYGCGGLRTPPLARLDVADGSYSSAPRYYSHAGTEAGLSNERFGVARSGDRSGPSLRVGLEVGSGDQRVRVSIGKTSKGKRGKTESAPIWKPFIRNFEKCAPGCEPTDYGTWGKRGNRSCHPTGEAIDIFGMTCGNKHYPALNAPRNGPFQKMVRCMKEKMGMSVLYRDKDPKKHGLTKAHYDHAHFSYTCKVDGRRVK